MNLFLRDRNPQVVEAWISQFRPYPNVEVSCGDIFDGPVADAIVSPANSFGFMDGGIDAVYSRRWPHLQGELQAKLNLSYAGQLPVGCATTLVITEKPECPSVLISAPTMRLPGSIRGTSNVYLAFRAALLAFRSFNQNEIRAQSGEAGYTQRLRILKSMLCPGMGTAIGMMEPEIAAFQMLRAYQHVMIQPFRVEDRMDSALDLEFDLIRGHFFDKETLT